MRQAEVTFKNKDGKEIKIDIKEQVDGSGLAIKVDAGENPDEHDGFFHTTFANLFLNILGIDKKEDIQGDTK